MLVSVVLLVSIAVVIGFNFNYDKVSLIVLGIIIISVLAYVVYHRKVSFKTNKHNLGFLFREIVKVFAILFLLGLFLTKIKLPNSLTEQPIDSKVDTEEVVLYTDSSETAHVKYYQSKQTWYDFQKRKHILKFRVDYDDVMKSKENRESLSRVDYSNKTKTRFDSKTNTVYYTYHFLWNKLYNKLVENDKPLIENLALEFHNYQIQNNLNRKEFAELMITAIQDIPYVLIRPDSCKVNETKPCVGNIKFGLFSPVEYVSNLSGDCDTRTVLLFTLLSRFNYDVAILNSVEYQHSILGINIPSTGKFKRYKQKKYYFVETTARGCPIGYLSQSVSNIAYWNFELIHNLKS